ncbi:hypothetical protein ACQEU3_43725 [Spirillospora sp. CA-253888]
MVLVDGARHHLDLIQTEARRCGVQIHIVLDVVHVLEKLWDASWDVHRAGDPAAEDWVATRALALLAGNLDHVLTTLNAEATALPLHRCRALKAAIRYLTNNADHLRYDEALERGWPIATGVIEGAVRYIVGDRLDITGARWGLTGAEAVLKLRILIANEGLGAYWCHHLEREHQRVHRSSYPAKYGLTV